MNDQGDLKKHPSVTRNGFRVVIEKGGEDEETEEIREI